MINLLPYDIKKQTRAARANVVLIRYVVVLGIAITFVALACGASYLFLNFEKSTNDQVAERTKTQKVSPNSAQGQTNTFRSELITAKNILDQQFTYSDVLTNLGALLPKGVILDNLSLTDSSFGASVNFKVHATSADLESKLSQAISSSTQFSGYTLITKTDDASYAGYPTAISFSTTLNKGITR